MRCLNSIASSIPRRRSVKRFIAETLVIFGKVGHEPLTRPPQTMTAVSADTR